MTTEIPAYQIEDHSGEWVVSFSADCAGPEEPAWNDLRAWVQANGLDYRRRRFIGCAPRGHHPQGEDHAAGEGEAVHEYLAQMLLSEGESSGSFLGAAVLPAPQGLFLVGDVALDQFAPDGSLDMGASMEHSFGAMARFLEELGGYAFDFARGPYYEEHIFSNAWFEGQGELDGFKLWLPVRRI